MLRSLRFRLPALFLVAIVLAGLVSTAVAVGVSKRYAQTTLRKQAFRQLANEAGGINQIYTAHAGGTPPDSRELERASGDQIYYVQRAKGIDLFPGSPTPAFTLLPRSILDFNRILAGESVQFEFTPPDRTTRLLGFARPVKLGDQVFGAVILARPTTPTRLPPDATTSPFPRCRGTTRSATYPSGSARWRRSSRRPMRSSETSS